MDYKYAVFIGRFQPFHNEHLNVVTQALTEAQELIMVIGSCHAARNIKNPWSFEERKHMILSCLSDADRKRVHFVPVRDYFYSDNMWVTNIQSAVDHITKGEQSIALMGSYKDSSSYYLKYFPQWEFVAAKTNKSLNATDIRDAFFSDGYIESNQYIEETCPDSVVEFLQDFEDESTELYDKLYDEMKFIKDYKKQWANTPYPVTFNTVDTVVIQSGHVLVVRRKFNPGKGLLALPGGFIKQTETLEQAAVRELKEETGIRVNTDVLKTNIVGSKVFDHPNRSLRGRTITHAFCIRLASGDLPAIKASDDASEAIWLPLMDIGRLEPEFYEDHSHIINHFISRF